MNEHGFSVQLKSREYLTYITISEKRGEPVLIEGILGEMEALEIIEESVLQFTGTKGTLMVDLTNSEPKKWQIQITKRETKDL
jgi:hypothetical protein